MRRVVRWLGRRHAAIHRADETTRRAETRLRHVEQVIEEQRQEAQRPAVNLIYDRITHHAGETHG